MNLPAIYIEPAIADTVEARLTIQYCHDNGHEYESLPEKFIRQRRPGIKSNCIAVASVPYCLALFRYFDATPEPLDPYPEELHHILHRRVIRTTLGLVPPDYSGFIRPVSGAKLWTGCLIRDESELRRLRMHSRHTPGYLSEEIRFLTEWRFYFQDGRIVARHWYAGDPILKPDETAVAEMSALLVRPPAAFALDFGILNTGELALVEMNDAFGLGWYLSNGIDKYLNMLRARFAEILKSER